MSESQEVSVESPVPITVRTSDAQSEIFVLDARGRLVQQAIGPTHTFLLERGIYLVKVRTGTEYQEKTVVLRDAHREPVYFQHASFPSPIPLASTTKTHEYHEEAAHRHSVKVDQELGHGSSIFLLVRDWTAPGWQRRAGSTDFRRPVTIPPATGLTIFSLRGAVAEKMADLSAIATTNMKDDPWSAANISVDPGVYELRLSLPSGGILHQTIVAPKDRHVQVYLLMRGYAGASPAAGDSATTEWRADLSGAAILLKRTPGFSSDEAALRLSELARVALATKRRGRPGDATHKILPEQTRDLLRFKLDDPMLGIYGGHLLLLESIPDIPLLGHVVANLRALVGLSHPDVEALALRTELNREVAHIEHPPMLRRSWCIITEESVRRPGLVPDSLISGPAPLLWPEDPWHVWQTSETPEMSENTDDLSELEEAVAERLGISAKVRRAARLQDRQARDEEQDRRRQASHGESYGGAMGFGSDQGLAMASGPQKHTISVALKAEDLSTAARQFGLPREQLERVIGKVQQKINRLRFDIDVDVQLPPRSGPSTS